MHPSRKAEEIMTHNVGRATATDSAQVYAMLAIADALQNISTSIDKLKEGFISIEVVSPVELEIRDTPPIQITQR